MQSRSSQAVVPAALAAGASLLVVLCGTLFSEYMFKHHDLVQKDDPWSLFVVQAMHPFGLTGLVSDSPDGSIDVFSSDSPWLVLLGGGLAVVAVFGLTLLALGSLAPGRSAVAAWTSTWFATIGGGAIGGLAVGLVKAFNGSDDDLFEASGALAARVWFVNGVQWGFMFGAFIGLLAMLVWVVRGGGAAPAEAGPHDRLPVAGSEGNQ